MPSGRPIMTNKRKRDDAGEDRVKRPRIRKRSRSEPLMNDTDNSEKRQALKRLFGRMCSVEMENNSQRAEEPEPEPEPEPEYYGDENDDPLMDTVPVNMDPEQLGFLVCAQETLRFLHCRGIPTHHPVFARLRSRLMQGIDELAMA